MNYIKLVNQFWQVRRSIRVTNLQADLYFFLLQECNERGWQNPFQCSNITIMAGISVAMSSLQDARKKLVEHGLITFEPGQKNISNPTYAIVQSIAVNRHRNRYSAGNETGDGPAIPSEHKEINENGKQKHKHSAVPAEPAAKKTKDPAETTEHWKKLVDVWFNFYELKFEIQPTFNAQAGKNLKSLVLAIKKVSAAKNFEWTEINAVRALEHFLKKAYADKFLKANFLLKNLYSHFDKIITPTNDGTNNGQKPATGAAVSTASAFDKIDHLAAANGTPGHQGGG